MSPEQVRVIPVSEKQAEAVKSAAEKLRAAGLRVEADLRNEKLGYKIREAQMQKVPYMLIIGEREAADGTVSVRSRRDGDIGAMPFDEFIALARREVEEKAK
jgi:threonyl-tRNA synthetase